MDHPVTLTQMSHSHLNRAQKRAFILRDELKFLDPYHLDTFLEGISNPEPPNYQLVNGKIIPPLKDVMLKEKATRMDLGNVRLHGEKRIRRVHLVIEAGTCEMRESEALPDDDANLQSVPIEQYIAGNMIPLFLKKYETIDARKRTLNETRRFAHNAVNQPKIRISEGKTLGKLNASDAEQSRKRALGEPVARHSSNKRKRIGLDSIPDNTKSETFNSIPDQVKIDLFNTIIKTAFPNFDDLMMASWNVVSVYLNTGSEDKVLHRAITDLNAVLREFEACYGRTKKKTETQQKTSQEQLLPPGGSSDGDSGQPSLESATASQDTDSTGPRNRSPIRTQQVIHHENGVSEEELRGAQYNRMTDSHQLNPRFALEQQEEAIRRKREKIREQLALYHKNGRLDGIPTQDGSPRSTPTGVRNGGYPYDHHGAAGRDMRQYPEQQYSPRQKPGHPTKPSHDARWEVHSDTELGRLFEEEAQDMIDAAEREIRAQDDSRQATTQGVFLGQSKLGAPKPSGTAPVAPMMHTRK